MTAGRYRSVLERLFSARRFGVKLELDRMRSLLASLGDPQRRLERVIHVGGTNGKGSTGAFSESLLTALGYRVGVFSSPHLLRLSERFRIAGAEAGEGDIEDVATRVLASGDPLGATFFELVTAIALVLFAEAQVDAAVMEVGLGGRFDATNVLRPAVSVVTGVDFDHQEYLGDTIEAIAGEKAGIFKAGVPAVVGRAGVPAAVPVLVAAAEAAGAQPVSVAEPEAVAGLSLGLRGPHQRANAACARRAVELIAGEERVALVVGDALAAARCAGRLERIGRGPDVWVDGAHNPGAAAVLVKALLELGIEKCSLVLGISSGKDVAGLARALVPGAARVWCTEARGDRAAPASAIAGAARAAAAGLANSPDVVVQPDVAVALAEARSQGETVVVAGSLFLVGDAKRLVAGEHADPFVITDPVRG